MAQNTKEKTEETKKVETKEAETKPTKPVFKEEADGKTFAEFVYPASELADNHKAFGTSREIVSVALRLAGKDYATVSEAERIIEKFKNKEVK